MASSRGTRYYRSGGTLVPLFFWALLTGLGATLALQVATNRSSGPDAIRVAYLLAALAVLFGPLAFLVYLLRWCFVRVGIDLEQGIVLSGNRRVPWSEIQSVDLLEPPFKDLIRANPFIFIYTAGCMALLYYIVLPAVILFTPWHRRVIVTLRDGTRITLRDLSGAEQLIEEVSQRIHRGA